MDEEETKCVICGRGTQEAGSMRQFGDDSKWYCSDSITGVKGCFEKLFQEKDSSPIILRSKLICPFCKHEFIFEGEPLDDGVCECKAKWSGPGYEGEYTFWKRRIKDGS